MEVRLKNVTLSHKKGHTNTRYPTNLKNLHCS